MRRTGTGAGAAVTSADDEMLADIVLGSLPTGVIVQAPDGVIVAWNAAAERLLGWSAPDALGRTLADLRLAELAGVGARTRRHSARQMLLRTAAGDDAAFLVQATRISTSDMRRAVVFAVTQLPRPPLSRAASTASAASPERLEKMLQHAADIVALVDRSGTVTFVNHGAELHTGFTAAELVGREAVELVHPHDAGRARSELTELLRNENVSRRLAFRLLTKSGRHTWMEGHGVNLLGDPSVAGVLISLHDVTERVAIESRLAHDATHDALTGLANRVLFLDRLDHDLQHARRHGSMLAILFVDLDRFKVVNDRAGHFVGDRLLIEVAGRVGRVVRTEDTVARLGGDEFVICAVIEDESSAVTLAQRLLDALVIDVTLSGGEHQIVSASVGVAIGAPDIGSELLSEADAAMYEAKHAGGRRCALRRVSSR